MIGVGPLNVINIPQKSVSHRIAGYEEVVMFGRSNAYLPRSTAVGPENTTEAPDEWTKHSTREEIVVRTSKVKLLPVSAESLVAHTPAEIG